jgi:glutathione synthase/RimK-type ligase-like ATP-grasp enzyme
MFDKTACSALLSASGCPIPESLGTPSGFDELMSLMDARKQPRLFLKLCHGSSASGAVALERSGALIQGFSTTRLIDSAEGGIKLYNERKVIRYDSLHDLRKLIDALCKQRALAEAWIPKAGIQQRRFDVRVVVIGRKARHVVARLSRTPFTNLQLGGTRMDSASLRQHLGDAAYEKILHAAEDAMRAFPQCLFAGVDVALESNLRRAHVLEVNAFGDLLSGLLHEGRDTYTWEVEEMLRQVSCSGR